MQLDGLFYMILYFIVTVVVAWIAFSLILLWAKPAFYTAGGAVNWGVTFWVALVVILLAWVIMLVLYWLVKLFFGKKKKGCGKVDECEEVKTDCGCPKPEPVCYDKCGNPLKKEKTMGGWMGMDY